ncbi:L,D-transpeptidase [Leptothermofonsia sp. ETS-13]|uniref:L,D-transpeptidase n=1 Tax=Leptothermofonsia sp. ETS-13 TaxID=3035696 RepID=UPI003B9F51D3
MQHCLVKLVLQTLNFATWGLGGAAPKQGFHSCTLQQNFRFAVLAFGSLAAIVLTDATLDFNKRAYANTSTVELLTQPGNVVELNIPLPKPPAETPSSSLSTSSNSSFSESVSSQSDTADSDIKPQTLRLEVQLKRRRVVLYQGETVVKSYPIAIGRPGWETPKGTYKVLQKLKNPTWIHPLKKGVSIPAGDPENPLGRYWIGFWTDGKNWIGFHGTPNPSSVGRAASHGCIRMYNKDIEELYQKVSLETQVKVVE